MTARDGDTARTDTGQSLPGGLATDERLQLRTLERRLRQEGWRGRGGYAVWLREWARLTAAIDDYADTVDDYLDDLFAREGLAVLLARCPPPLQQRLARPVLALDDRFLAATGPDLDEVLQTVLVFERLVCCLDHTDGFWWHRVPLRGPLATVLRDSGAEHRREELRWRAFAERRPVRDNR